MWPRWAADGSLSRGQQVQGGMTDGPAPTCHPNESTGHGWTVYWCDGLSEYDDTVGFCKSASNYTITLSTHFNIS